MNTRAILERRQHHQVREVFANACSFLAPVVTGNDQGIMISHFAMLHMVQDRFPELSSSEAQIIIATVENVHRNERIHAIIKGNAAANKS